MFFFGTLTHDLDVSATSWRPLHHLFCIRPAKNEDVELFFWMLAHLRPKSCQYWIYLFNLYFHATKLSDTKNIQFWILLFHRKFEYGNYSFKLSRKYFNEKANIITVIYKSMCNSTCLYAYLFIIIWINGKKLTNALVMQIMAQQFQLAKYTRK